MKGATLLEIGCACSSWLPYFAKEYGFEVSGIDYSEIGCEQERQILYRAGVQGSIICADLFHPPDNLIEVFDVVLSMGVAEHFEDTSRYIQAVMRYMKKGGIVITIIPNMTGIIGWAQKTANRRVYDIHVPLTTEDLKRAHYDSGINVLTCDYLIPLNFGMCNLSGVKTNSLAFIITFPIIALLRRGSYLVRLLEKINGNIKSNQQLATYVMCVGVK